jgi:hypothetical protein
MPIDQIILPLTCHANGIFGTSNVYAQPDHSELATATYRGFPIERYNSQQSASCFFSPLGEFFSKIGIKIRNLCLYRPAHRPYSGSNPNVGHYLDLRLKKIALVSNVIDKFVKVFDSPQADPDNFRKRSFSEQGHWDRLISDSPEITLPSLFCKANSQAPDIYDIGGSGFDPGFSPVFLEEMRFLEATIVTALRNFDEKANAGIPIESPEAA